MTMPRLGIVLFCVGVVMGSVITSRVMSPTRARESNRVDTLRVIEARLDTVYRERVSTLERWRVAYDTSRVTDTVMVADTVYMRRDVADSAVMSCYAVVETCELRATNLGEQIVALRGVVEEEARARKRWRWVASVLGVAIGITVLR